MIADASIILFYLLLPFFTSVMESREYHATLPLYDRMAVKGLSLPFQLLIAIFSQPGAARRPRCGLPHF